MVLKGEETYTLGSKEEIRPPMASERVAQYVKIMTRTETVVIIT